MAKTSLTSFQCASYNTTRVGYSRARDIQPSGNVCRMLFGPVDHEELRQDIEKDRRKMVENQKIEYNYDFEKDKPLDGRYLWEPLAKCVDSCTDRKSLGSQEKNVEIGVKGSRSVEKRNERCNKVLKNDIKTHTCKISSFFRLKKRKLDEQSQDNEDPTRKSDDCLGTPEDHNGAKRRQTSAGGNKGIANVGKVIKEDSTETTQNIFQSVPARDFNKIQ